MSTPPEHQLPTADELDERRTALLLFASATGRPAVCQPRSIRHNPLRPLGHPAFGINVYRCLGERLATAELKVMLRCIASHRLQFGLAPARHHRTSVTRGFDTPPVSISAA